LLIYILPKQIPIVEVTDVINAFPIPKDIYKGESRAVWTSDQNEGRVSYHGNISMTGNVTVNP
jgi:hypothetical protein